ncbi:hypothetical protein PS3A_42340 [Pseudomonas sp. 3A(2025)]
MDTQRLQHNAPTDSAVQVCIQRIEQWRQEGAGSCSSPLFTSLEVLRRLEQEASLHGQLQVINDRADNQRSDTPISAWPLWFSERARHEQPLFYLTQSATSAHVSMLTSQIGERGIVLNDIESSPSRWAKGAHPWLPLWLAANRHCLPFDPACGEEALVVLAGALQSLYLDAQPAFCYMTLHDEPGEDVACDRTQAWLGMYRLPSGSEQTGPCIRLLGAGLMLREVRAAAQLLEQEWGVNGEVWSCPSYTRLARDAEAVQRWNRRHRNETSRRCHLHECLAATHEPVLAVTGYAEFVAAQIGAHLTAPFSALGADSLAPDQHLNRYWMVYSALQALVREGQFSAQVLCQAQQRYRLV